MSDVPTADVQWIGAPVLRTAADECRRARLAWECVAPPNGRLPDNPTPLQLLLHTRMVTSNFIAAMGNRVGGATAAPDSGIMEPSRVPAS
jgi:hypothetical protein